MGKLSHTFQDLALYMSRRAPTLIARKGIETVCGLLAFAVLARVLTKEQFAIYSLVFGFIAILRLTALPGLGTAISQAFSRGVQGEFRQATILSFLGSFFGAIIMMGAALWHFHLEDVTTGQVFFVAGVCFPLHAGLSLWKNAVVGSERYFTFLLFDGFSSIIKCAAIIICAYIFPGVLFPIVIAVLSVPSLINLLATIDQMQKVPANAIRESNSVEYGIWTTIYQLPTVLAQQLDRVVLFYFISPEALAVYAVALRIPELARAVVGDTNSTLGPVFAREKVYTRALHMFSIKLWLFYCVVSIAGAIFVVPYLLLFLAGPTYVDAVPYAQIMTVGAALGYLGGIQFRYVKSHLHSENFLSITLTKALLDCVLILGLAYCFGLVGLVAAYSLKNFGYSFITNFVINRNYLKVRTSRTLVAEEHS